MRMTHDQLMALAELARDHEADEAHITSVCDSSLGADIDVDLYKGDEQHFHVNAVITGRGEVRESIQTPRLVA